MTNIEYSLRHRFGEADRVPDHPSPDVWDALATRGSVRTFKPDPVEPELVRRLSALAFCSPTKSDLQQRDIIYVVEPELQRQIMSLIEAQEWTGQIPTLLIFCGNNRRQRQIHEMRGHPFANDHLDAFFNAAVDAGIALSAFVIAAEAIGLGCCPISAVRNSPRRLSTLLKLPSHVFPVAGLALGWPLEQAQISPRLPLDITFHENTFDEIGTAEKIAQYDTRRASIRPYARQRNTARFGVSDVYGWSEEKARQYAEPERTDFGSYIRNQKFNLD